MPSFDRFDICEAHSLIEMYYHNGGWLRERPSNQRRMEATSIQLDRLQFRNGASRYFELAENGRDIYRDLVKRYGFAVIHSASEPCEFLPSDLELLTLQYTTDEPDHVTCEDCLLIQSEV